MFPRAFLSENFYCDPCFPLGSLEYFHLPKPHPNLAAIVAQYLSLETRMQNYWGKEEEEEGSDWLVAKDRSWPSANDTCRWKSRQHLRLGHHLHLLPQHPQWQLPPHPLHCPPCIHGHLLVPYLWDGPHRHPLGLLDLHLRLPLHHSISISTSCGRVRTQGCYGGPSRWAHCRYRIASQLP